jgi:hypothetical protein
MALFSSLNAFCDKKNWIRFSSLKSWLQVMASSHSRSLSVQNGVSFASTENLEKIRLHLIKLWQAFDLE